MGLLVWAQEKLRPIEKAVRSGANHFFSLTGSTYSVATSPYVIDNVINYARMYCEGFSRIANSENFTVLFSAKETRGVLKESCQANILYYLMPVLAYELAKNQMPDFENTPLEYPAYVMDWTFFLFFLSIAARRFYDNIIYNAATTKTTIDENEVNKQYQGCKCDDSALLQASLSSSLYFSFALITVYASSFIPVVRLLAPLGYALTYGQNLVETKLSSVGICTDHRAEVLAKNNSYSLGMGSALFASINLGCYLIWRWLGVESPFIYDALFGLFYQPFILASLLREKPLPSLETGIDLFYYHRIIMRFILKNGFESIYTQLNDKSETEQTTESHHKNFFQSLIASMIALFHANSFQFIARKLLIPLQMIKPIFLYDYWSDWRNREAFENCPSNRLFFKIYYDKIHHELQKIIDLRDKPLNAPVAEWPQNIIARKVPMLPKSLTRGLLGLSDDYIKLIEIIFHRQLENPLKFILAELQRIHKQQAQPLLRVDSFEVIPEEDKPKPATLFVQGPLTHIIQDDFFGEQQTTIRKAKANSTSFVNLDDDSEEEPRVQKTRTQKLYVDLDDEELIIKQPDSDSDDGELKIKQLDSDSDDDWCELSSSPSPLQANSVFKREKSSVAHRTSSPSFKM